MYRIIAHRYPNNETRVTYSAIPNAREFSYFDPPPSPSQAAPDRLDILPIGELSLFQGDKFQDSEENSVSPLSLGLYSKPERSSAGYGHLPVKPTAFGLNAKRQLIRSGAALEHEAPPHECLFLTGTLPGSTVDAFTAIAAYSGYIVNSLKAWIAKRVTQKLDFYCWELQKRGALHLHYCCHIPNQSDRDHILSEFREWWISCLSRVGERSNCDLFRKNSEWSWLSDLSKVRAVAEVCRKSPARYLAKYLSKSASPSRGSARAFTPSRWWGTSRPLKNLLISLTKTCEIIVGSYHAVIRKLETVKSVCDSSDAVTFRYRHPYGIGDTTICYPNSEQENIHLWKSLQAQSIMNQTNSRVNSNPPSELLEVLRTRLIQWSDHWLLNLSDSFQGLKVSLQTFSNMMRLTILLPSTESLPFILHWSARISDIRSLSSFTPALQGKDKEMISDTLDQLENCIKEIANNGWS